MSESCHDVGSLKTVTWYFTRVCKWFVHPFNDWNFKRLELYAEILGWFYHREERRLYGWNPTDQACLSFNLPTLRFQFTVEISIHLQYHAEVLPQFIYRAEGAFSEVSSYTELDFWGRPRHTRFVGLFSGLNDPRHSSKPIVSLQIRNEQLEPDFLRYCTSMCSPGIIFKYFATCLQKITIL